MSFSNTFVWFMIISGKGIVEDGYESTDYEEFGRIFG